MSQTTLVDDDAVTYAIQPCEVKEVGGIADLDVGVDGVDPAWEKGRHRAEDRKDGTPILGK